MPQSKWPRFRKQMTTNVGDNVGKGNHHSLLAKIQIGYSLLGKPVWRFLKRLEIDLALFDPYDSYEPALPLCAFTSKTLYSTTETLAPPYLLPL